MEDYMDLIADHGSPLGIQGIVVELEELGVVTMTQWNGECYNDCYKSTLSGYPLEKDPKSYRLEPVTVEESEDQYKVVGYKEV